MRLPARFRSIVTQRLTQLNDALIAARTKKVQREALYNQVRAMAATTTPDAIPAIARRPHDRIPWQLNFLPSDSGLAEAREVAREVLGIGYYTVRGWYRF